MKPMKSHNDNVELSSGRNLCLFLVSMILLLHPLAAIWFTPEKSFEAAPELALAVAVGARSGITSSRSEGNSVTSTPNQSLDGAGDPMTSLNQEVSTAEPVSQEPTSRSSDSSQDSPIQKRTDKNEVGNSVTEKSKRTDDESPEAPVSPDPSFPSPSSNTAAEASRDGEITASLESHFFPVFSQLPEVNFASCRSVCPELRNADDLVRNVERVGSFACCSSRRNLSFSDSECTKFVASETIIIPDRTIGVEGAGKSELNDAEDSASAVLLSFSDVLVLKTGEIFNWTFETSLDSVQISVPKPDRVFDGAVLNLLLPCDTSDEETDKSWLEQLYFPALMSVSADVLSSVTGVILREKHKNLFLNLSPWVFGVDFVPSGSKRGWMFEAKSVFPSTVSPPSSPLAIFSEKSRHATWYLKSMIQPLLLLSPSPHSLPSPPSSPLSSLRLLRNDHFLSDISHSPPQIREFNTPSDFDDLNVGWKVAFVSERETGGKAGGRGGEEKRNRVRNEREILNWIRLIFSPEATEVLSLQGKGRNGREIFARGRGEVAAKRTFNKAVLLIFSLSPTSLLALLPSLLFLPPNAMLLEIKGGDGENDREKIKIADLAASLGLRYLVAEGCEEGEGESQGEGERSFYCDIEKLKTQLFRLWSEDTTQEMMGFRQWEQRGEREKMKMGEEKNGGPTYPLSASPDFSSFLPGTKLRDAKRVREFQEWTDCVSNRGRWEYDDTPRFLPWSPYQYGMCDRQHLLKKKEKSGISPVAFDLADEIAANSEADKSLWNVRNSVKFRWKLPAESSCGSSDDFWREFDPVVFCEKFGRGKKYFFLGDSLNLEMLHLLRDELDRVIAPQNDKSSSSDSREMEGSDSLMISNTHGYMTTRQNVDLTPFFRRVRVRHMASEAWSKTKHEKYLASFRADDEFCPGLELSFLRSENLIMNFTQPEYSILNMPFFLADEFREADVIVVNTGAHWHSYSEDLSYLKNLDIFLNFTRATYPDKLIIYRSTPPGHFQNCSLETKPISNWYEADQLPYQYGEFFHRNLIAKRLVQRYGGVYMDVDEMTALRPDGHFGHRMNSKLNDCLHYCSPGPLSEWIKFFYNILWRVL